MKPRITHDNSGDRTLISVEVPCEAVTSGGFVGHNDVTVTMDVADWHDTAKRVLDEERRAMRELSPDRVCWNVEDSLRQAAKRPATLDCDPELSRRRGIANIAHRIGDYLTSGVVTEFSLRWEDPDAEITFVTGRGERRRTRTISLKMSPSGMDELVTLEMEPLSGGDSRPNWTCPAGSMECAIRRMCTNACGAHDGKPR